MAIKLNQMKKTTILLLITTFFLQGFAQNAKLDAGELYVASGYDNLIPIHWEEDGSNITEYQIFRKTESTEFELIATLSPGTWTYANYIDENVTTGTEYTYVIKNQNGNPFTNESSATCNNTGYNLVIPGYGTTSPTLDGVKTASEWDDALLVDITDNVNIFGTGDWDELTNAYFKFADNKIFIAIEDYNNTGLDDNDQFTLFFDFNNDNQWSEGINGGHDGRYAVSYFDDSVIESWDDLSGEYPNISFSNSIFDPTEISVEVADNGTFLFYEIAIDITGWSLDIDENNFGMLIQNSVYNFVGDGEGTSGIYSPGAIWRAPISFANCTIQLEADNTAPELVSVDGLQAVVDNDMEIILSISDISLLETVVGEYSISGGETYTLTFEQSKINYGYSATIPAQNSECTGEIEFYIEDNHGNSFSSESYTLEWLIDDVAPTIETISTPEIATNGNIPIISANIFDDMSNLQNVSLIYTIVGEAQQTVSMSEISGLFIAELPDKNVGTSADYYISAEDQAGNIATSDSYHIVWYEGGWYGVTEGGYTGNNFGSVNGLTIGVVMQLGDFEGKINKLAYMVPSYCLSDWSWKIVEIDATDLNNVVWTDNVLVQEQTYSEDMTFDVNYWTEIDIDSDVKITGDVGLVISMQPSSYWGRDAESTQGLSWFYNSNTDEWERLGYGDWVDFPGDWTVKAHLYGETNQTNLEMIFGNDIITYNYPNPCDNYTNIYFQNPNQGNVKITVFDINGKQISILLNNHLEKGNYNVQLNTSDFQSGTYFYTVEIRNKIISKKIIKK